MFKERFGHCNVVSGWPEDPGLASWVSKQRIKKKKALLTDEQIRDLDWLGFTWNYQQVKCQADWMERYEALERYTRQHGNPHVPRMYSHRNLIESVWLLLSRKPGITGASTEQNEML